MTNLICEVYISISKYDVLSSNVRANIQIKSDNNEYEIEGNITAYNSGRAEEFTFEPNWFSDDDAEKFYDNNFEEIEEIVIEKFLNHKI